MNPYDFLVIDSNPHICDRFKQIANEVPLIRTTSFVNSLKEGVATLDLIPNLSNIFISSEIELEATQNFLQIARSSTSCKTAKFISLLRPHHAEKTHISRSIQTGFDAFLTEPFSVFRLEELVKSVNIITINSEEQRQEIAITLLIKELLSIVDQIAKERSSGLNATYSYSKVSEACKELAKLSVSAKEVYLKHLIQQTRKSVPPIK